MGLLIEVRQGTRMAPEDHFNPVGRAVSSAHPNDLGRKAKRDTQINEIGVLADNRISMVAGEAPDSKIRGPIKSDRIDVCRVRVKIGQPFYETR